MSEKKIPVRVDEGQYDILSQIRQDIGTPVAESVRRAIYEYIKIKYPGYLSTQSGDHRDAKLFIAGLD